MIHVNYLAISTATAIVILFSAIYYILLNGQVTKARSAHAGKNTDIRTIMSPNKMIIELARTFTTGLVIAYAVLFLNLLYVNQALLVGFWLWLGFPVVLLLGSVIHEHFPARLAVIHAGDWLVKILIFSVILTIWH